MLCGDLSPNRCSSSEHGVMMIACPVCQRDMSLLWSNVSDADEVSTFSIYKCSHCGLGATSPIPENLGDYYQTQYYGGRHGFTAKLCDRRRIRFVERHCKGQSRGKMLDVGCGDGSFLHTAKMLGWETWGVETHPKLAREKGLAVMDTLEDASQQSPFDCITLWHVLEHFRSPVEEIASVSKLLSPQGKLFFAVPNWGSLQSRWFGPRWLALDLPRHLFHFTEHSLNHLLSSHGFRCLETRHSEFEYDLMGWVQSTLNVFSRQNNLFFKIITGKKCDVSMPQRVVQMVGGSALSGIGLVPMLLASERGAGGTLMLACERQDLKGSI